LEPAVRRRVKEEKSQANTVEYRAKDGRHIVTLNLGEGMFSAVRALAHVDGHSTPQSYILDRICNDTAQLLPQITNEEAAEFVQWQGVQESPAQVPVLKHEITLRLPERAHTILAGIAAAEDYDSIEEMILTHESSLAAQSRGDQDEKGYAKMFGLS
jgi:hypothetical protein